VVCEGRFYEQMGDAMGAAQKVVLEQTTSALGVAAVLHNVGKKITGASCEAYVFFLKTVPVIFFGALAKE
jgi:hypothetical protein